MEISQKRHSNRIRFRFGDEELEYQLQDSSGSRAFSLPYVDVSRDRQTLEERNQWLRNAGLLWLALGLGLTAMSAFGDDPFRMSFWVWIGLACYGAYWLRRTRFVLLPSEKGNLFVIDDAEGTRIIQEIESRRAAQFLQRYDFINAEESPQQQQNRFRWLHREGALSDTELQQRLAMVATSEATTESGAGSADSDASRHLLN
ncbi:hypothetical protein [Pseudoxanthomonas wuyuanensis]